MYITETPKLIHKSGNTYDIYTTELRKKFCQLYLKIIYDIMSSSALTNILHMSSIVLPIIATS